MAIGCDHVRERINDYIDGLLNDEEQADFSAHTESCPECGALLRSLTVTRGLAAELEREPPEMLVPGAIFKIRAESKRPFFARYGVGIGTLAAMAAVLAIVLMSSLGREAFVRPESAAGGLDKADIEEGSDNARDAGIIESDMYDGGADDDCDKAGEQSEPSVMMDDADAPPADEVDDTPPSKGLSGSPGRQFYDEDEDGGRTGEPGGEASPEPDEDTQAAASEAPDSPGDEDLSATGRTPPLPDLPFSAVMAVTGGRYERLPALFGEYQISGREGWHFAYAPAAMWEEFAEALQAAGFTVQPMEGARDLPGYDGDAGMIVIAYTT